MEQSVIENGFNKNKKIVPKAKTPQPNCFKPGELANKPEDTNYVGVPDCCSPERTRTAQSTWSPLSLKKRFPFLLQYSCGLHALKLPCREFECIKSLELNSLPLKVLRKRASRRTQSAVVVVQKHGIHRTDTVCISAIHDEREQEPTCSHNPHTCTSE